MRGSRSLQRERRPGLLRLALIGALLAVLLGAATPGGASPVSPEHACRFWGMIGPAPDDAAITDQLVTGTYAFEKLASANSDGWGIAYYAPALSVPGLERPQILRGGPPANHDFDSRFAEAVSEFLNLDATCAIAHLRAASSGHDGAPDPHPFQRGNLALAHNGTLSVTILTNLLLANDPKYFDEHPPDYVNPYIDSELFYAYILKLREQGVPRRDGARSHATADAIAQATLDLYDAGGVSSSANCIVLSPDTLYALRFDPSNASRYRLRYTKVPGAWVVASEAVGSDTTGWESVPRKSLAIFTTIGLPQFMTIYPPAEPWLAIEETKIDDDTLGQSWGNDDRTLDAGERVELQIMLRNDGTLPASSVSVQLQTSDSLATLIDSVAFYPNIGPGGIGIPLDPLVVSISPDFTLYHLFSFTVTISAGLGGDPHIWVRTLTLYAEAPDLVAHSTQVVDGEDGQLDPGETADLQLWLQNSGVEDATSLSATLVSGSSYVEVIQGQAGLDTLAAGDFDLLSPAYTLSVSPECPVPEVLSLRASITADWGITSEVPFDLPVGGFNDNIESGEGTWSHAAGIPGYGDQWHVSSLRNHTAGGSRSWKCGAPDSGMVYAGLLDAILTSPVIPLAEITELRFWHFTHSDLASGHFGKARDGGIVEASINDGPWVQLYPATGYDFVIEAQNPPCPFPPGTPVFAGFWGWRQATFPIEGFSGTIQFHFRFGSDAEGGREGWYIDDVQVLGQSQPSDVPYVSDLPLTPDLQVGGPNPFRETTLVLYDVVRPGPIDLAILDLEGRVVRHLLRASSTPGRHRILWDGRDADGRPVPSGLYFYRLRDDGDGTDEVQRVIRVR